MPPQGSAYLTPDSDGKPLSLSSGPQRWTCQWLALATLLALICQFSPQMAGASEWSTNSSITATTIADDNLQFTSAARERDLITRISPAFAAEIHSEPLLVMAKYGLNAEYYDEHAEFNSLNAGDQAELKIHYRPDARLTLQMDSDYIRTQQPGELNTTTGLGQTRVMATRASLLPVVSYRLGPLADANLSYKFSRDHIAAGLDTDTHIAALGYDLRFTERDRFGIAYAWREYRFGGSTSDHSQVLLFGETHQFNPRTSATLQLGPRLIKGELEPELNASVRYAMVRGELSFAYVRSQSTVVGEVGVVATESVETSAAWSFERVWAWRVSLGSYLNTRAEHRARAYQCGLEMNYLVANTVSLFASYQLNRQRGSLGTTEDDSISRNILSIGVVIATPRRPGTTPAFPHSMPIP